MALFHFYIRIYTMKNSVKAFPPLAIPLMIKEAWQSIMTIEHSPLRKLPPQLGLMIFLILSLMWSGIFSAIISNPYIFGWTAGGHVLVVCGIFITAIVHAEAEKTPNNIDYTIKSGKYNGRAFNGEHE
jgi:hypothetical protein